MKSILLSFDFNFIDLSFHSGIASGVIQDNLPPRFNFKGNLVTMEEDSTYPPDQPKYRNVFVDITTTFTMFVAIYFPSCTGILAGSNRSGDLADAQKLVSIIYEKK